MSIVIIKKYKKLVFGNMQGFSDYRFFGMLFSMMNQAPWKKTTISQRIKTLRKSLKLTQKEFAQKIYVSTSFQTLIELEQKRVLDRHIKLITSAFGVNEAWLRTGEGEMFEKGTILNHKIIETVEVFKQLNPFFQDFILDQLYKLLEYEKKNNNKKNNRQ